MVRMNDSRNPVVVVILFLIFPGGHGPFRAWRAATNGGARKWDEGSSELRLGYSIPMGGLGWWNGGKK